MASEEVVKYVADIKKQLNRGDYRLEYADMLFKAGIMAIERDDDEKYGLNVLKGAKQVIETLIKRQSGGTVWELIEYCDDNFEKYEVLDMWYDIVRYEGFYLFESYLIYLEKDRKKQDRFYLPKMAQLKKHNIIQSMQDLEDDKLDLLTISMPPSTQKSTALKFFASWVIGRHLSDYSLFMSHNREIDDMFYRSVLDITTNNVEYCWREIFPNAKLEATNAKNMTINFNGYKPYANLQCSSLGSGNAGKVRCNRYLFCDDLISGIEEALNKNQLDKIWQLYGVDARQRKLNEQVKEIHIATRWSVHDVIGRLQQAYEGSHRTRFIAVPDIDPKTGLSNFEYKYNGMTAKFFQDQAKIMDDISYQCLYKNEPIEREGLLYNDDELRRYIELPSQEPDAILGVCDTKTSGSDFMVLPVMYQYGTDYYMVDCICDDSTDFGNQQRRIANLILKHNMQQVEFESNAGGSRLAFDVDKIVQEKNGRCNITTKPTETNKETRIIVNSDWIKRNVLFKSAEFYTPKSDYGKFIHQLLTYSVKGKNPHDDVPDALANFALYVTKQTVNNSVQAVFNPFRRKY